MYSIIIVIVYIMKPHHILYTSYVTDTSFCIHHNVTDTSFCIHHMSLTLHSVYIICHWHFILYTSYVTDTSFCIHHMSLTLHSVNCVVYLCYMYLDHTYICIIYICAISNKIIWILTFLSPLLHVPLPFTKQTCCTAIERMQSMNLE